MWIIRFLNGPMAGKILPLKKSTTLLGRAPNCDIKIASAGVSKEHTRIEIFDNKIIISDAGSRNGTFLNGTQIRSQKAKSGDRIAIHDIYLEIQNVPDQMAAQWMRSAAQPPFPNSPPHSMPAHASVAYQASPQLESEYEPEPQAQSFSIAQKIPEWSAQANSYFEQVVMPALYKFPELVEFKWVLASFMALFILLVTSLSTVPLIRILRSSIERESQQHALTIATTLARANRASLVAGQEMAANVEIATSRPGVDKAFILNNVDGSIVAPASQAGSYPSLSFVHQARKEPKEAVSQVDDSTVIAMVPIMIFNQDTGVQTASHWAVVVYDMRSLAVNDGQVLNLFISTLFIALILGLVLFFLLYKLIEYPLTSLNTQLDQALKEGHDSIAVDYQFPAIQTLASNVSSALSRALNSSDGPGRAQVEHDRNREMANIVELIGFAAMAIRSHDLSIAAINQAFESRLGANANQLTSATVNQIPDQALKLSIQDLIERLDRNPDELSTNNLEFSGVNFQIIAQAIFGSAKIAYYLIVMVPLEGES